MGIRISKRTWIATLMALTLLVALAGGSNAFAYNRYNDGCQNCHGAFTDGTSPKGTVFLGDNKHEMHRSGGLMDTECDLCHSAGDQKNPYMGSSDGTAFNPGIGCTGCHDARGLRQHHFNNGETCAPCHSASEVPPPESQKPVYYDTPDTKASNPCNTGGAPFSEENWSNGDTEGQDNDGDNLYDADDPDCGPSQTPGEVSDPDVQQMLVTAHNKVMNMMTVSYSVACAATENNVEYGPLNQVSTYAYSGQVCSVGNSGSSVWTYPAGSVFFILVGQDGANEGSYGTDSDGNERPEDTATGCGTLSQDLLFRCD